MTTKPLLLLLCILVGCGKPEPKPKPTIPVDPMSASVLVKTHPRLRYICEHAGGCKFVKVSCLRFDNSGNSNLRDEVYVDIRTLSGDITDGYAFSSAERTRSVSRLIDAAIESYFKHYDEYKSKAEIMPNATPCNEDCQP